MDNRPKIDIPRSTTDIIIEIIGWGVVAVGWFLVLLKLTNLSQVVPIFPNLSETVDENSSKWVLFFLSVISTVFYSGLLYLSRFPHILNYAVPITEQNAPWQYTRVAKFMRVIGILSVAPLTFAQFGILFSFSGGSGVVIGFVLLFVAVIFILLRYYIWESIKKM